MCEKRKAVRQKRDVWKNGDEGKLVDKMTRLHKKEMDERKYVANDMLIVRQKRDVWKNIDRGNIYNKRDIGGKEEYRFLQEWRLHSKGARKRYT